MKIGEYIKDYRNRMGISQRKFAAQCDLSNAFISMLEKGENPKTKKPIELSIQKYKKIATATGITVDKLFEILGSDAPVIITNPVQMLPISKQFHPDVIALLDSNISEKQTPTFDEILCKSYHEAPEAIQLAVRKLLELEGLEE